MRPLYFIFLANLSLVFFQTGSGFARESAVNWEAIGKEYSEGVLPLLRRYCLKCHSTEKSKGELDLERFRQLAQVRAELKPWQKIIHQLVNDEMPPKKSSQLSAAEERLLLGWIDSLLAGEARERAGDPGRVILRRLNNTEYDNTVHDLTGLELDPTRQFPVDGAAGEGFSNTGASLVMSPSLVNKYLDAARDIARHLVLTPDGIEFFKGTTRPEWSYTLVNEVKEYYRRYVSAGGKVALDGYLEATLSLRGGTGTPQALAAMAAERKLNRKYLSALWKVLTSKTDSPVIDRLQVVWRDSKPGELGALKSTIEGLQKILWKINNVGHYKKWQEEVDAVMEAVALETPVEPGRGEGESVIYLTAGSGGGDGEGWVLWDLPRLEGGRGKPIYLRDLRVVHRRLETETASVLEALPSYLAAAAAVDRKEGSRDELAAKHGLDTNMLARFLGFTGIGGPASPVKTYLVEKWRHDQHPLVKGWGPKSTPNIVSNPTDGTIRIPGWLRPHKVVVHPFPGVFVAVGWKSPVAGIFKAEFFVKDEHPECGNGVGWKLELWRNGATRVLASGLLDKGAETKPRSIDNVEIERGDYVSLVIDPRDNSHSCDLTGVDLVLSEAGEKKRRWDLAADVSGNLHDANPHDDSLGNHGVWHFYRGQIAEKTPPGDLIPKGSILAQWREALTAGESIEKLSALAMEARRRLADGQGQVGADLELLNRLKAVTGPFFGGVDLAAETAAGDRLENEERFGLAPEVFGSRPGGAKFDGRSVAARVPSVLEIRIPAGLAVGRVFKVTARVEPKLGSNGIIQASVLRKNPADANLAVAGSPLLASSGGRGSARLKAANEEFRRHFPPAMCYTPVVPLDEIVTLKLYYREDDYLLRMMLGEEEARELDRRWDRLTYISQEPLKLVDSFEQISEFSTQDRPDMVIIFARYDKPIRERARKFEKRLVATEPIHLKALLGLAERAWRRSLTPAEKEQLLAVYQSLRKAGKRHEESLRNVFTAILVSPNFLFKVERPGPGKEASPVSAFELATRLSYFLWSSAPDARLRAAAEDGSLLKPKILRDETLRLLKDDRVRSLATEFAAQWLLVRDFDKLAEKNEKLFPGFDRQLREAIYEETILFFKNLFLGDGQVREILAADHTYLNDRLARHYGIPGVEGPGWRKVDGVRKYGRGGLLGFASVLARQSGASRTSPVLRGNFIVEFLLGEELPDPPSTVPEIPDAEAREGLSVRQLVERHRSAPECSGCHARIDPYGFALEAYDAIGRRREKDNTGHPVDSRSILRDGTSFEGIEGLREYLLQERGGEFLRQFCRKLVGFALGRSVGLSDELLVEEMLASLRKNGDRFSEAVLVLVKSRQFRYHRGRDHMEENR
jgi:hypothetical protein